MVRATGRARVHWLALAAWLLCPVAAAQASGPEAPREQRTSSTVAAARAAFREGMAHARARRFEEARAAFERAYALYPHAATLWNLALSELELGASSAARAHLLSALERAEQNPGELDSSTRAAVEQRLAELDAQSVDQAPGSGRALEVAAPLVAPEPVAPAQETPSPPRRAEHSSPPAPPRESPARSPLQLPAFGVAAAGAVSAIVFGVLALDAADDLHELCPTKSRCPAGTSDQQQTVARYAILADASLLVAVAAAGVGVYVTLSPPSTRPRSGASLVVTGRF